MLLSRRIIRGRSFLRHLTAAAPSVVTTEIKSTSVNRFSSSVKSKLDYSHKLNNLYNVNGRYFSSSAVDNQPIDGIVDVPLAQTGEGIAECELLKWFVNEVGETLLQLTVDDTSISSDASETSLGSETSDSDDEKSEFKKSGGLSTPAVRSLAKQHGIGLDDVIGTGKQGRILKEDVLKYGVEKGIIEDKPGIFNPGSIEPMEGPEEKLHEIADSIYHDKTLTLRAYQRAMVKSMTAAASVPHFHYVEELNCDGLVQLKTAFQKANTDPDLKFTFLPILIKSLSLALTTHPLVNSTFNLANYEVTLKGHHNIGIAMATPSGLVVPNIKNIQTLSILEITKELSRLQKLAMANKLPPADISGGTITLSNIGSIGGKYGSPLINVPEVAIIALGRIQKVAQFKDDGTAYPVSIMTVNIAADHRILDGANVALFCKDWKLYIEKPELLLLHMR
ncbi:lipoamide acyltransferase component of branched-chain alpha-keto acid dehydrogenase complex, mitochondrial [Tanacetum coccineum]|uniref:Lipoamide acyltransferase component of branched-chain alpha-keto acid dehydrogenase complex, mitochondrial n=1 Tax=Tanacetum coccineum TaxID=301880 RepID=A0ABQ4ZHX1_9ASTR